MTTGARGASPDAGALPLDALGPLSILETIDEGKVTTVYRATLDGEPVALKVFKPRSIRRHADRHAVGIAEYEYERNRAFHGAPGLARYVVRPVGFLQTSGVSAVVQELLEGELYLHYHRRHAALGRDARLEELFGHVRRIVERAHAAELYDLDLHALNVMVVREGGEPIPKLFDFNRIPFYERPRNPLEWLLLRARLLDRGSRDRRKLRQFHDFTRLEHRFRKGFPG